MRQYKSLRGLGVQSGESQLSIHKVPLLTTGRSTSFVGVRHTFYLESKGVLEEKQHFLRGKISGRIQT